MSRDEEIQRWHRLYKQETGAREVLLEEFADWMVGKGWPLPTPITARERLVKQCAAALRIETKTDQETGEPYRVNHMYIVIREGDQYHLWFDIDDAEREPMQAALTLRREQVVGDMTQLVRDAEHWSRRNPEDEPIVIQMDLGLDVEIRRSTPADV